MPCDWEASSFWSSCSAFSSASGMGTIRVQVLGKGRGSSSL